MGKMFENLTWDQLCDLMCGGPEDDGEKQLKKRNKTDKRCEEDSISGAGLSKRSKKKYRTNRLKI